MIIIKRNDVLVSYLSVFIRLASNIVVLPLILNNLNATEYGLWSLFISIGSFVVVFDLGFGVVISRYVTFAFCGAKSIPKTGLPEINQEAYNEELLSKVLLIAKRIYKKLSILSALFIIAMSIYIGVTTKSQISIEISISAFIIYGIGAIFNMYFMSYSNFVKGLGKVKESQKLIIVNQMVYIILQIVFVYFGMGIIGLSCANLITSVLLRFQLKILVSKVFGNTFLKNIKHFLLVKNDDLYNSISHNAKGIGLILISNYILGQGSVFLTSMFLNLQQIASYSLSLQVITLISNLSTLPFNVYLPMMGALNLDKKYEKLKSMYALYTVLAFVLFIMGAVIIVLFGNNLLVLIKAKTSFINTTGLIVLSVYNFIVTNHTRSTNFISLNNIQPYVKSYIISSFISLFLNIIVLLMGGGIIGLLLTNTIVQIVYNGWKWPSVSMKMLELTYINMLKLFYKSLKSNLNFK